MALRVNMRTPDRAWWERHYPEQARERYGETSSTSSLLEQLQRQQDKARKANEARLGEAKGLYQRAIERYGEGGTFGRGVEAQIERGREQSIAQGSQALASSGLFNTTIRAGLGKKYEEEVGQPARLKLEDLRMGRLTEAERGLAGLVERVEDVGPDQGLVAQLMSQASSKPSFTRHVVYGKPQGGKLGYGV